MITDTQMIEAAYLGGFEPSREGLSFTELLREAIAYVINLNK